MLVKTYSAAVNGLDVTTVTVEVNIVPGVMYRMTGLGDMAVREGRDRIASAVQFNGYKFPHGDITINLAPADLRKLVRSAACHRHFGGKRSHNKRCAQPVYDGGRIGP